MPSLFREKAGEKKTKGGTKQRCQLFLVLKLDKTSERGTKGYI
jgi:hypothetical protein